MGGVGMGGAGCNSFARPAVLSARRSSSASRFPLRRGGADNRLNVCIVPENEPCRMVGKDIGGVG